MVGRALAGSLTGSEHPNQWEPIVAPCQIAATEPLRLQQKGTIVCSMLMRDPERRHAQNPREHRFHNYTHLSINLSPLKQLNPPGKYAHYNALYNILGGQEGRVSCEKSAE